MANTSLESEVAPAVHSKPLTASPKTPVPTECSLTQSPASKGDEFVAEWGFELDTLYKMAKQFFCQNEGKAFHISYEDKLKLIAYTQQQKYGSYDESKCKPVGYLDLIGQDRREAWMDLGSMEVAVAKQEFVALLHDRCPLFRPFVCAHKASLQKKEERPDSTSDTATPPSSTASSPIHHQNGPNENMIKTALNQQTFDQFSAYAAQQCPNNPEQQLSIIRQLQEEHFRQYMLQLAEQTAALQLNGRQTPNEQQSAVTVNSTELESSDQIVQTEYDHHTESDMEHRERHSDSEEGSLISVAEPTMWTRPEIVEFKETIRQEGGDSIIKVGHGETVTVRVPTHEDGQCLFWEFATDQYDIGFGVYFEWNRTPGNTVSVHISDSESESCEDYESNAAADDVEAVKAVVDDGPATSVIIPIYRRDSHQEVYVGKHQYPGHGIYLLKFDNSYSLWRGKTLYYRVYYTR